MFSKQKKKPKSVKNKNQLHFQQIQAAITETMRYFWKCWNYYFQFSCTSWLTNWFSVWCPVWKLSRSKLWFWKLVFSVQKATLKSVSRYVKNLITVELSPYFLPAVLKKKMPTFSRCTCFSIAKLTLASVAHRLQCKGAEDRQDTQEGAYTSHPLDLTRPN